MASRYIIYFLLVSLLRGVAGEAPQPPATYSRPPQAWLGLHVAKPDETTTSHLPLLPPGVGFVIDRLDEDGPAARAGLQKFDVLWKYRDQMLINEAQLATLLRHAKPGEKVELSAFRKGKPVTATLTLGEAPEGEDGFIGKVAESVMLPDEKTPMRVITYSPSREASFSTDEGRAVIRRDGELYKVVIRSPENKVLYEGEFENGSDFRKVPRDWRRRVCALRRGLDHAMEDRTTPLRPPRPRVVPPSAPGS